MRQVVAPAALASLAQASVFSPGVRAGDFLFLTGATGGDTDGGMPDDAARQTANALMKALALIDAAGGTAHSIVEMTSYHVGMDNHFDAVDAVVRQVLGLPLPAWTAIEVAGLRRAGAVIELRIVAHVPQV